MLNFRRACGTRARSDLGQDINRLGILNQHHQPLLLLPHPRQHLYQFPFRLLPCRFVLIERSHVGVKVSGLFESFASCGCGVKVLDLGFEGRDLREEDSVFLEEGVVCVCCLFRFLGGRLLLFCYFLIDEKVEEGRGKGG